MSGLFETISLTLGISGLGGSGYFLLTLGVLCGGLGMYFRKESLKPPAPAQPTKGKKNKKSKKNKKQSEHVRKPKAEGGSLIWGGLGLLVLGIGMVVADLAR